MRIFNKSLAVAACAAAVTFGAVAPPAHAGVTFYSDANFLGSRMRTEGTNHLSWMSDCASSFSLHSDGCRWRYYEDSHYRGRRFDSSSDLNYLRGLSHAGLHWGETWDDRISSVMHVGC